ncbi:MAG TPA: serine hydrolase domain-containing protein [Egicoccus sp.]|nr:serine hydrolase domain-containing protein [Egicoccus sp.]HSK25107.1 serine hydrolase domain-containing protein [Egicoccus sp.]
MGGLEAAIDAAAHQHGFSGVVRLDRGGAVEVARAYGEANRALSVPNTLATRFGIASGVKGLTALTVMSLVEDGVLALDTPARALLGDDLPLVDDDVTVEHLLAHRSGIGDYLDEDADLDITDHVLSVPVHRLAAPEDYLQVLGGHPTTFVPGERFAYCNGGYVLLALLAERAAGTAFHDLVTRRVCEPAGMTATAFLRSDELPGDAALGYLHGDGLRTNVLHLPVRGSGDGGVYTTVADVHALWAALFAGRIVPPERVRQMTAPVSDVPDEGRRYGLGFWLDAVGDAVIVEGYDAGVSFRSVNDPAAAVTWTVIANWSDGAWPMARRLRELTAAG